MILRCDICGVYVAPRAARSLERAGQAWVCVDRKRCDRRVARHIWLAGMSGRFRRAGWNASPQARAGRP